MHMRRGCTSFNVKHEGPLEIYICADPTCARIEAKCEHQTGMWNADPAKNTLTNTTEWRQVSEPNSDDPFDDLDDGRRLFCTYCGLDVT